VLKDFITQAETPLGDAFAQFRAAGASDVILDLRYNGGGRISTAARLASLVAGAAHAGALFTTLRYNANHHSSDTAYDFAPTPGPPITRVVAVVARRTCSASELVVNGLTPYIALATIGEASCGKPFGFNPVNSCGSTFSVVNFDVVNSLGAGSYYDGLPVTCAVADTFTGTLGDPAEQLTGAALTYLGTGACPAAAGASAPAAMATRRRGGLDPGDRQGMIAD
jgi:carboxyl-terminal processing protease